MSDLIGLIILAALFCAGVYGAYYIGTRFFKGAAQTIVLGAAGLILLLILIGFFTGHIPMPRVRL